MCTNHRGNGILNDVINKLPFECHITPYYQYCGAGTKLHDRLRRGDQGINPLDAACKTHDIAYSIHRDIAKRHEADAVLEQEAWRRVQANDSSMGEKTAAWLVTNAMKVKRKLGMGLKKTTKAKIGRGLKKVGKKTFGSIVKETTKQLKRLGPLSVEDSAKIALACARNIVKAAGGKRTISTPRVIPIPKSGGFLPLLPAIFGGLTALGALAGGASQIARAVKDSKAANEQMIEAKRHNKAMECIALGQKGKGLYLGPHKTGLGLYIQPSKN